MASATQMSICAGCGQPYNSYHQCNYSGANLQEQQLQQLNNVWEGPTYQSTQLTDILEALKRIEDLLREMKK